MCRSSWESYELLFITNKRLFSLLYVHMPQVIHFRLILIVAVIILPLCALLSCRSNDDYRRLIVYRCEWREKRALEEENKKRKKKRKKKKYNQHTQLFIDYYWTATVSNIIHTLKSSRVHLIIKLNTYIISILKI